MTRPADFTYSLYIGNEFVPSIPRNLLATKEVVEKFLKRFQEMGTLLYGEFGQPKHRLHEPHYLFLERLRVVKTENIAVRIHHVEIVDVPFSSEKKLLIKANKALQAHGLDKSDYKLGLRGLAHDGVISEIITFDLIRN